MTTTEDIDSRIDDVESSLDDANSSISDLEDGIQKLNEDLNIWGLFNEKMIPYVYDKTLYKIVEKLEEKNFKETVGCFKKLNNNIDIPYSLNKENYKKRKKILRCTTFLKNSKEFFEAARVASFDTKPIFYYYSISYLFAFLLESFVYFDKPKPHHGIYVNTDNGINSIRFNYNHVGGFFERVVHTLSMLHYPSSFSSLIPDFNDEEQTILCKQKTDISISTTNSILLSKLLEHDFNKDSINLELNTRSHRLYYRYEKTSAILRDFILIFISSAVARYNPILWRNIYSGEDSNLIFNFEKSFTNINDMIRLLNDIIIQAEKGTLLLEPTYPLFKD